MKKNHHVNYTGIKTLKNKMNLRLPSVNLANNHFMKLRYCTKMSVTFKFIDKNYL